MVLHRIATKPHVHDMSGTGAMLFGGRWNQQGTRMVYTSESLSLAALEVIANISSDKFGRNFYCIEIDFPDSLAIDQIQELPNQWNAYPHISQTVVMGTEYFKKGVLCLQVPSAIIPTEYNYLLNPLHDDYHKIRIKDVRPLIMDRRLKM